MQRHGWVTDLGVVLLVSSTALFGGEGATAQESGAGSEVTAKGFVFRSDGCVREAQKVICTIGITNTLEAEQEFIVFSQYGSYLSSLIGANGEQYLPDSMRFGALAKGPQLQQQLPPGVMMNVVYTFQDVPIDVFPAALRLAGRNHTAHEDVSAVLTNLPAQEEK